MGLRPFLALIAGVWLGFAHAGAGLAQDAPGGLMLKAKKARYDDVKFELNNAIVNRGLVVDFNGQIGNMLERTGPDVGSTKRIYLKAEYFIFCSARLSRQMMEADARNLGLCPFVVFIYEPSDSPGTIYVGHRQLSPASHASGPVIAEINKLLDGIVADAVK
ncbi:MAG: DUF302 domain-containing protein [Hyphomicrobiaceae bacterium]